MKVKTKKYSDLLLLYFLGIGKSFASQSLYGVIILDS